MDLKTIFRRQIPNKVIVTSLLHLLRFVHVVKMAGNDEYSLAKIKLKAEWGFVSCQTDSWRSIFIFMTSICDCFLHLVLVFSDAVNKPPGFSSNLQVFLP